MSATLLDHSTPKARKEHRCDCCFDTIPAGTVYVRQRIADDGVHQIKMHTSCYELLMDYSMFYALDGEEGMPDWGEVLQWDHEMKDGGP